MIFKKGSLKHLVSSLMRRPPSQADIGAFYRAACEGNDLTVTLCIDRYGVNIINARNSIGQTALGGAALGGQAHIAAVLLKNGAEVDALNNEGLTPLMIAAQHGFGKAAEVVVLLLEKGASVVTQDNSYKTAQDYAEKNGHPEIAAQLRITRQARYEAISPLYHPGK